MRTFAEEDVVQRFGVSLRAVIRPAVEEDLPRLEWFGQFTPQRELIRDAFRRQVLGEVVMLVAEANRFPIGQAWVDLVRMAAVDTGYLWAVRVLDPFHGLGIGTRLLAAGEEVIRRRGLARAQIGVEKHNARALALYERLGYHVAGDVQEEYGFTPPGGAPVRVALDEWVLRKPLRRDEGNDAGTEQG